MKKAWVLSYPLSAQRRLWSDWCQAGLSLRWAHSHFLVCHVAAHFVGFVMLFFTVGKEGSWYLLFVYTSYVSVLARNALTFGKQTLSFQFYYLWFGTYTIICGVKLLSFGINYFLLFFFSDYLEHSWNRLEYRNSISVLNNQKTLTESNWCLTMVISCRIWWFMC